MLVVITAMISNKMFSQDPDFGPPGLISWAESCFNGASFRNEHGRRRDIVLSVERRRSVGSVVDDVGSFALFQGVISAPNGSEILVKR